MDLKKNCIPQTVNKIHLTAVCGTGMGALACMLRDMGYSVSGSDQKVYPPMSTFLIQKGIGIQEGFCAENIAHAPDLVIIGNAVRKDNPEVAAVYEMGLPFCSMPQALNHFAAYGKKTLLITGTHGKTTTSALLAWVLFHAGLDPSFMIGGILKNFNSNYRLGNGEYIVIEGDEYDTAFFDKGPKLMHYRPSVAALTSIEFDHADIFTDLNHVNRIFKGFVDALPADSTLVAFDRDANIDQLVSNGTTHVVRYGRQATSSWRLGEVSISPPWIHFEVFKHGKPFGHFQSGLPGEHNLFNTLAVIAMANAIGIGAQDIAKALTRFESIKRRQEIRGVKRGITVMDDFAHHPTAVKETIRAVKPFYPNGRLIAVFEPRTNTSMRNVFQGVYPAAFDGADMICIRKPPLLEKIPADQRFSSEKLVQDLKNRGKTAWFFPDTAPIIDFLASEAKPDDLILIMSNGGFDNIHERLLNLL
ncbi:MAG: UDP-N-acetylmuramate:L-alanyl-gamma-D-glutamyl-meso-diaminopimelate ligase [Desulfobacterales bacterium]|jgi:UDP-N-acetylmuramate: L-alanyl-gamma-D-glutamyl-meso-diaminopimelate ligase|nr:UDP-N-acetylmuramate:L-alanyl-gamma-D-glutamyl-meso-diaminopimelate ligase [Desulfobacterales bacterium]